MHSRVCPVVQTLAAGLAAAVGAVGGGLSLETESNTSAPSSVQSRCKRLVW